MRVARILTDGENFLSPEHHGELLSYQEEWEEIQKRIWMCNNCVAYPRVERNLRQQTEVPTERPVRLLIVAVAPPFEPGKVCKTKAMSATNNPRDKLRLFVEESLQLSWPELVRRGLFLLHPVKCAIIPNSDGYQNPENKVVDACVSDHLINEIRMTRPPIILALGGTARRAVARSLGDYKTTGLRVTGPLSGTFLTETEGRKWQIIVTRHIRGTGRKVARKALCQAAELAGVMAPC